MARTDIELQRKFWNGWNVCREHSQGEVSSDQLEVVSGWLGDLGGRPRILEVGCGAGWTVGTLLQFGHVTATDLADEVLERAKKRHPPAEFVAGDFMALQFSGFDVLVCLEVLSHVADQPAFVVKLASALKSGGELILATQNRPVLERSSAVQPAKPGQLRKWVDRAELTELLAPFFDIVEMRTITPISDQGLHRFVS